jgi:hypothetical protein
MDDARDTIKMATIANLPDEMLECIINHLVAGMGALSFADIASLGRMRLVNRAFGRAIDLSAFLRSLRVVVTLDNIHTMRSWMRAFIKQGQLARQVSEVWIHVNLDHDDYMAEGGPLLETHERLLRNTFKDIQKLLRACAELHTLNLSGRSFNYFRAPPLDKLQSLRLRFDDLEVPQGILYAASSLTSFVLLGDLQAHFDSLWHEEGRPALNMHTVHLQYLNRLAPLLHLQNLPMQPSKLCFTLEYDCGFEATARILQRQLSDHEDFKRSFWGRLKEVEVSMLKMSSEGQSVFKNDLNRIFASRDIKVTWRTEFPDFFPSHVVPEGVTLAPSALA